jgi:hypothetical protein
MVRAMSRILLVTAAMVAGLSAQSVRSVSLQGVWQIVEITTTGPGGSTNRSPQPNIYIFTAKHYSLTRVTSDGARPEFKDPAKVTADEALASWGPFQAQAGTYTVIGNELRRAPVVAKNPQTMRPGSRSGVDTVRVDGDILTISEKATSDGTPVPNPTTWRFKRIE